MTLSTDSMIVRDGNRFVVQGPVTLDNVVSVLEQGRKLFSDAEVVVDLGRVKAVDSSAVSLLMEWLRDAAQDKRKLHFINMPANMKSLAELYGVAELIPQG